MMEIKSKTGSELLKSLGIEGFSNIYKISLIILIILCIYFYKKYRITEELEDNLSHYHLTWTSLGMTIASVFCFTGSNTDPFYETFFNCLSVFMTLYYLYSQSSIANKEGMTTQRWLQSFLLGLIDIILIIKVSKDIVLLIILAQTLLIILYETKKLNADKKGE